MRCLSGPALSDALYFRKRTDEADLQPALLTTEAAIPLKYVMGYSSHAIISSMGHRHPGVSQSNVARRTHRIPFSDSQL